MQNMRSPYHGGCGGLRINLRLLDFYSSLPIFEML